MSPQNTETRSGALAGWTIAGLLLAWFAVAYLVGTTGVLANAGALPLPPIALTAVVPVVAFLAAYLLSGRVRRFVLSRDLRMLTALQLWRVIGFAFLPLYAVGVLPGIFAWPAGLGDVAIGVTAAFVVWRLERDADFATSNRFLWFQALGLLDFAVAVAMSGLASGVFPGLTAGGVTSAALDVWPLNLFPSFLVPLFIILHLTALLQVRQLRRRAATPLGVAVEAA